MVSRFDSPAKYLKWVILVTVVLVVVSLVLERQSGQVGIGGPMMSGVFKTEDIAQGVPARSMIVPPVPQVPPTDQADRLVIRDTSLSLQVEDVAKSIEEIEKIAKEKGGFLVDSNLNRPDEEDTGSITIRVPVEERMVVLSAIKGLGVRVVSETVSGVDVTAEYVDLEARLASVKEAKVRLEEILEKATTVTEILNVQREIDNLQQQIDYLVGQQKYLEESAKLIKISVFLATDELALPFAPDDAWRPGVVFKLTVRSLVRTFRGVVDALIYVLVYSPVWLPLLIIIWLLNRRRHE